MIYTDCNETENFLLNATTFSSKHGNYIAEFKEMLCFFVTDNIKIVKLSLALVKKKFILETIIKV